MIDFEYPNFVFWVNAANIIRLHDEAIQKTGGVPGIRDIGLLESAIDNPKNLLYYGNDEDREIYSITAAYFFSIIKNHAFVDGNKRAGLFAVLYFLEINNFDITVDYDVLYELAINTASSQKSLASIAQFFKEHITPLT